MRVEKFCECVGRYRRDFYVLALAILENSADAEDAVSNAIVKAYEHIGQVSAFHKFKPWMLAITKKRSIKAETQTSVSAGGPDAGSILEACHGAL